MRNFLVFSLLLWSNFSFAQTTGARTCEAIATERHELMT